jgi:4-amino-4-deoxy-L-arabinose transferase-like glycosyltransferase
MTTTAAPVGSHADRADTRADTPAIHGFALGPVVAIAAGVVALLVAMASRFGYHRDELYFLAASRHLAWGYVDQPPVAVAVAWLDRVLLGDSLLGLRLVPALLTGGVVVLTGAMARELGGSRFAQAFAALCVATGGFLAIGHLEGPTVYDVAVWALVSWLVLRILRTGDARLWVAVGLTVGLGMEAKQTVPLLLLGLALGFLANGQGSVFRSGWLWIGAACAVAGWAPNLVWQATHGWPTFAMDASLRREHSGAGYALKYPFITLLALGAVILPVWTSGWWALWTRPRFRRYRAFAVAFAFGFVLLWIVIPDRFYYLVGIYPVLFAAGGTVVDEVTRGSRGFFRAHARRRLLWRSRPWAFGMAIVGAALSIPIVLPVLPASAVASANLQKVNYNLGEEIGWPEFITRVTSVWDQLPRDVRAHATIVTDNYGEAGAVIQLGRSAGLPIAYSGHNSFWSWGPPPERATAAVAIGLDRAQLTPFFRSVRLATRVTNRVGVDNDEAGAPIWVCTGRKQPWSAIWPRFKHYG